MHVELQRVGLVASLGIQPAVHVLSLQVEAHFLVADHEKRAAALLDGCFGRQVGARKPMLIAQVPADVVLDLVRPP